MDRTDNTETGEIRALTGLRGVLALFVVQGHFLFYALFGGWARTALAHGYLAVDYFFILSGFVMAMVYAPAFAGRWRWRAFGDFLGRRLARIYPLYVVATLAKLAQMAFHVGNPNSPVPLTPGIVAAHALLVQSWGISRSYDQPSWSLSTEWAAYLLFPLFCALCLQRRAVAVVTGLASLLLLTALAVGPGQGTLSLWFGDTPWPLLRCLPEFALGLLAFRLAQVPAVRRALERRGVAAVLLLLCGILLAIPDSDVLIIALGPLLVIALLNARCGPARFLGSPVVHWFGQISYSLYLVNILFILKSDPRWHGMWGSAPMLVAYQFALAITAAFLTYELIEKPGRRWLRQKLKRC